MDGEEEMNERTLIVVKHDGVLKGIIGDITRRFEQMGMTIVGMKMVWADEKIADKHYETTDEWSKDVFEKAQKAKAKQGLDFPFTDYKKYGQMIKDWNTMGLKATATESFEVRSKWVHEKYSFVYIYLQGKNPEPLYSFRLKASHAFRS